MSTTASRRSHDTQEEYNNYPYVENVLTRWNDFDNLSEEAVSYMS